MTPGTRSLWPDIRRRARSTDDYDRTAALARAVGSVEIALTAAGIPRSSRALDRLKEAGKVPKRRSPSHAGNKRGDVTPVELALRARNEAVHGGRVPKPEECKAHISSLYSIWCQLRRTFVNRSNAAVLAEAISESQSFTDIFLFGSLARSTRNPWDLDFLLFDRGDYSYSFSKYHGDLPAQFYLVLEAADIDSQVNIAAMQLGWLDFVLIDGSRFGVDRSYTLGLARAQQDPLFFVNISESLRRFDKRSQRWVKQRPQVFERLALIRQQLEIEGLVPPDRPPKGFRMPRKGRRRAAASR